MKKSMLEKQLREVKELRAQLDKEPVQLETKPRGLRIVAMPLPKKGTLAKKLEGFKVA